MFHLFLVDDLDQVFTLCILCCNLCVGLCCCPHVIPCDFPVFFMFFLPIHLEFMKIGQTPKDLILERTWSYITWGRNRRRGRELVGGVLFEKYDRRDVGL